MIKLKKKIKISSRKLMLIESVDFFSFSDDDDEVSNLAFFHFFFFPKFYTSSVSYFSSPNFFLPPCSWTESTHNIRKMKNRVWLKKKKWTKIRHLGFFLISWMKIHMYSSKNWNQRMKQWNLLFVFSLCCVAFLFSCNERKSPSWFLSCRLIDGTNGFVG